MQKACTSNAGEEQPERGGRNGVTEKMQAERYNKDDHFRSGVTQLYHF